MWLSGALGEFEKKKRRKKSCKWKTLIISVLTTGAFFKEASQGICQALVVYVYNSNYINRLTIESDGFVQGNL